MCPSLLEVHLRCSFAITTSSLELDHDRRSRTTSTIWEDRTASQPAATSAPSRDCPSSYSCADRAWSASEARQPGRHRHRAGIPAPAADPQVEEM